MLTSPRLGPSFNTMDTIVHPKIESGFPDNCITLDDMIAGMRKIYKVPGFRVKRFKIECVTKDGDTLNLKFDRNKVGQNPSTHTD